VGSVDEAVWRSVEPGTPSLRARLDVVRRFAERGLHCSALMAPILPGLTDSVEQIEETVAAIAEAGAARLTPVVLHLRPGAREWYRSWLPREQPHLVPLYRELYGRGSYVPKAYGDAVVAAGAEAAGGSRRNGPARPGAREWYRSWLQRRNPRLVPLCGDLYGGGSYGPKAYGDAVVAAVHEAAGRYGLDGPGRHRPRKDRACPATPSQTPAPEAA